MKYDDFQTFGSFSNRVEILGTKLAKRLSYNELLERNIIRGMAHIKNDDDKVMLVLQIVFNLLSSA